MASERAFAALLLVASLGFAAEAHADPTAAQKATARDLMTQGRAQRDRNELKGALASFEAADAIMHVPTTGMELARTQTALGLLVEARDTVLRVLRIPARDDDGVAFAQARAAAAATDAELAERIPSVRLDLRGVPDGRTARIALDGADVPVAAASALLKLNPGHHGVIVTVDAATAREEFDVGERETKTVTVTLVIHAATVAPVPPARHTMRTLAIGGFTLAGIGVATGAVTGLLSISSTSAAKSACIDNRCPRSAQGDLDAAQTTATVSTIAFAAAGLGLVVGGIALLVGDGDTHAKALEPTRDAARVRVTPWIGAGHAGLRGSF